MTEWSGSDYHRQSSLQQAMADEVLGQLSLGGTERVLDVGCGDGRITAQIAARVPHGSVLGVDPSRDMIAFASSHYGPPVQANLRFEVGDARRLPYRQEFDLVVSFNALHWVPEQGAALDSIKAALKPGGRATLRFVPQGNRQSLEDVIEEVRRCPRWEEYFADFHCPYNHLSPAEYRELAEKRGLRILRLDLMDKAWDFQTREGFTAFAQATFVEWTRKLPEAERPEFIAEVLDRYCERTAASLAEANTFKFYQVNVEMRLAETMVEHE